MKHSEVVEKLKQEFKVSPIKITPSNSPADKLYDPNEELTNKAFQKYCEMWNKDEGSRKFLRHLIGSYMPWDSAHKIQTVESGKDKCCILNLKVAGLSEINDKWKALATVRHEMDGKEWYESTDKLSSKDSKKLKSMKQEMSPEVRRARFGYYSDGSDKILSREAGEALVRFVKEAIDAGDGEIYFIANRDRIIKENEKRDKEKANAAKKNDSKKGNKQNKQKKVWRPSSNCLDESTLDKLLQIKKTMPK